MHNLLKQFSKWYLLFLAVSSFLIPVLANAGECSSILGAKELSDPEEDAVSKQVCHNIESWSESSGYSLVKYLYGAYTDEENIFNAAEAFDQSWGIVWYIGHGAYDYRWFTWPYWHCEIHTGITTNLQHVVWDEEIYPHSGARRNHFVFLWSCYNGRVIGEDTPTGTIVGMPYAWLHTTDLSSDGYNYPDGKDYTFIGWRDKGPFLINTIAGVEHAGKYFVNNFYWAALHDRDTIIESLDHAAWMNWGKTFGKCKFWTGWGFPIKGYMKVYGDGNLVIGGV